MAVEGAAGDVAGGLNGGHTGLRRASVLSAVPRKPSAGARSALGLCSPTAANCIVPGLSFF
ncbi:hypothetical protein CGMCC3_g836 [Colletotrichum fructicola]|nr:uncharacterized protein CGMCC3_g836 [Colletotrichum fructicola]KAE9583243.1 hypothetical protein CGMCC3_g836 [Colletotrichum fructicola]